MWTQLPSMPAARQGMGFTSIASGDLIMFGGKAGESLDYTREFQSFLNFKISNLLLLLPLKPTLGNRV
jgi:hypothetical protein